MREGWIKNSFGAWQKVNNHVYVYINPLLFGAYGVQLYLRGNTTHCELEARSSTSVDLMFDLGERWLQQYGEEPERLPENYFHIMNPNGAWRKDYDKKAYWITAI